MIYKYFFDKDRKEETEPLFIIENSKFEKSQINIKKYLTAEVKTLIKNSVFYEKSLYFEVDCQNKWKAQVENCSFYHIEKSVFLRLRQFKEIYLTIIKSTFINSRVLVLTKYYNKDNDKKITIEISRNFIINGNSKFHYFYIPLSFINKYNSKMNDSVIMITKNEFEYLKCKDNNDLIHFQGHLPLKILDNTFKNISNCYYGFNLNGGSEIQISNNFFENIQIEYSFLYLWNNFRSTIIIQYFILLNNTFQTIESNNYGLSLYLYRSNAEIFSNKVYDSRSDVFWFIHVSNGNRPLVLVKNNEFKRNWGHANIALYGSNTPDINENVFLTPNTKYDIHVQIFSLMGDSYGNILNAGNNFWNSLNPLQRIFASNFDGNLIRVNVSKFYKDEKKQILVEFKQKSFQNLGNISGLIEDDFEINDDMEIVGTTVFLKKVRIHAGVIITIKNCYFNVIFKDELIIEGTQENPVQFKLYEEKEFRLEGDYLKRFEKKKWLHVVFKKKENYKNEYAVVCKHFCRQYYGG